MTTIADWKRPHPLSVLVLVASFVSGNAMPLIFVVVFGGGGLGLDNIALVVGGATVGVGALGWYMTGYAVTDDAVHYRSGILSREARSISLARVQQVAVAEPLLARAVGLAVVQVSEASADGDIEIRYLGKSEADGLARRLRAIVREQPGSEIGDPASSSLAPPPEPPAVLIHETPIRALFRYRIAMAAPLILLSLVPAALAVALAGLAEGGQVLGLVSISVVLAILIPTGFSIAIEILSYGGFRLERSRRSLLAQAGLLSRRHLEVRPERVQTLSVTSGPVARRWQLHRIVFAAATGKVVQKNQPLTVLSPAASTTEVAKIMQGSIDVDPAFAVPLEPVSALTVRRQLVRSAVAYVLFVVPISVALGFVHVAAAFIPTLLWWPAAVWHARERYRRLGVSLDGLRLVARSGVLSHQLTQVPLAHVQTVSTSASYFQRRLGLVDLIVATAGVGPHNYVVVPDLPAGRGRTLELALARAAASTVWEASA